MISEFRWLAGLLAFPLRLRRPLQVVCLLAALVAIPRFWYDLTGDRSDPELLVLARMEPSYFTALAQTARELPPATVSPEVAAEYSHAFPALPLLLHAAAWRWGGLPGLLAADVLVTMLSYCLWCAIFRLLLGRTALALLCGATTVNGSAGHLLGWLRAGFGSTYFAAGPVSKALVFAAIVAGLGAALWQVRRRTPLPSWVRVVLVMVLVGWIVHVRFDNGFWSLRFPRPFVTGLFSYTWLLALLIAWRHPRLRLPDFLSGIAAGLTLQTDPYSFGSLGLVTLAVWLLRGKINWRALATFAIPFALTAAPFVLQQMGVSHEMRLRLGQTPLPRSTFWSVTCAYVGPPGLIAFTVAVLVAACYLCQTRQRRPALWVFVWLVLANAASPALLIGATGQAVQVWHYLFLTPVVFSLCGWVALSAAAGSLLGRASSLPKGLALGIAVLSGATAAILPARGSNFGGSWTAPHPPLRALLRELRQPAYASCHVLGTWRPEVRAWWAAFRGTVINPDPFATNLSDAELERRLLRLAQLQEVPPEKLGALLRKRDDDCLAVWELGHFKYSLSDWYSLAPSSDYSHDEEGGFALPNPIVTRLLAAYPTGASSLNCDLIIRTTPAEQARQAPPGFVSTYTNSEYQVLRREAGVR